MNLIKNSASYLVKIFINHFVSGIYSLLLFVLFTTVLEGKLQFFSSVISVLFYLFLVYSVMWEAGAKRAVGYDSSKIRAKDGFILMAVGSAPFYLITFVSSVLSFFTTNSEFSERFIDVVYDLTFSVTALFGQCMYSGVFTQIFEETTKVSALIYLASLIPGLAVGGFAYRFGTKNFRLRTIFGIKYNEEKEKIKNNY